MVFHNCYGKNKRKCSGIFCFTTKGECVIIFEPQDSGSQLHGGVAHLGERLNGIQEVVGSIPIVSTKKPELSKSSGFFIYALNRITECVALYLYNIRLLLIMKYYLKMLKY